MAWVFQGIPSLYTHCSHYKHVTKWRESPHPGAARVAAGFQQKIFGPAGFRTWKRAERNRWDRAGAGCSQKLLRPSVYH